MQIKKIQLHENQRFSGHWENKVFRCAGNSKNFPACQKSSIFVHNKNYWKYMYRGEVNAN